MFWSLFFPIPLKNVHRGFLGFEPPPPPTPPKNPNNDVWLNFRGGRGSRGRETEGAIGPEILVPP